MYNNQDNEFTYSGTVNDPLENYILIFLLICIIGSKDDNNEPSQHSNDPPSAQFVLERVSVLTWLLIVAFNRPYENWPGQYSSSSSSNNHTRLTGQESQFPTEYSSIHQSPQIDGPSSSSSGSSGPNVAHAWVQTGLVTGSKFLNQYVIDHSTDDVPCFTCGWGGCTHRSAFPQKSQLLTHIRSVHLEEKPYKCTTCQTTFARKQDAVRHVETANGGDRHHCAYW
ncbi:hypothetical protein BU17DRAFT_65828 [Hysterangium stoloniferum]|nr:hypothetical protein BU17DRAFT_65828 [Hysterangium stoloniferum]